MKNTNRVFTYCSAKGEDMEFIIGEVFVNGQNQDVWCNSKMPITDMNMYHDNAPFLDGEATINPSYYLLSQDANITRLEPLNYDLEKGNSNPLHFICE